MVVVKQHYMNNAVNLQSAHIKKRKQHIFGGKRCRYAVSARTVTKKDYVVYASQQVYLDFFRAW